MALAIAEADTVSSKFFDPKAKQQVYEASSLLKLLQAREGGIVGGTSIQWPVRYKKLARGGSTGARTSIKFQSVQTRTGADISMAYYSYDTMIHWDERRENMGKPKIMDLLGDRSTELGEEFADDLATDIYATNANGLGVTGLDDIVSSSVTYAGIAVADAAAWAAIQDTTTTRLTLYGPTSLMYAIDQATFGSLTPTHIVTTRNLLSRIRALLHPLTRYESDETARKVGIRSVIFEDTTCVSDPFCTASALYGLDLKNLRLVVDPDFDPDISKWGTLDQIGYQHAWKKVLSWVGNMQCRCRKTQFKFTLLDYAV